MKLKTCVHQIGKSGTHSAVMHVSKNGVFSIKTPEGGEISGPDASELEKQWRQSVRDYVALTRAERKVIGILFDSHLRRDGSKTIFLRESGLTLQVGIFLETTVSIGDKRMITLTGHPDVDGMHVMNPIPVGFRLTAQTAEFHDATIIEWSAEVEDMMVRACKGIKAVVDMLDDTLATPETILLACQSGRLLSLPSE